MQISHQLHHIILNLKELNIIQHLTEFNAVPGTVETFDILNGGSDYTAAASITINGDGTGARAKLFVQLFCELH